MIKTAIDDDLVDTIQAVASIQIVSGLVSTVNRQEQATQQCAPLSFLIPHMNVFTISLNSRFQSQFLLDPMLQSCQMELFYTIFKLERRRMMLGCLEYNAIVDNFSISIARARSGQRAGGGG
jgi:hypothetical protein